MTAYYNEIDPKAAAWLRELIARDLIAPGDVDERSIEDVTPASLAGYDQCHLFAGIGVWSYALRQAGWPDDRPVWTGSCPCQPFSAAGKGGGFADERHLWPAFYWLIGQCRPDVVFGEQVASNDGRAWLDLVSTDLEAQDYACGAASTVACGFGAPHKRQRLYWVADALSAGRAQGRAEPGRGQTSGGGPSGVMADADGRNASTEGLQCSGQHGLQQEDGGTGCVADAGGEGRQGRLHRGQDAGRDAQHGHAGHGSTTDRPGPLNGFWRTADWLLCRDGKWRPVEPRTFPLAAGAPARVGRLRGYGNALNAQQARAFIQAYMNPMHCSRWA